MKIHDVPQGSTAWLKCREGRITASRIRDVMNTLKNGGESQARFSYKWELIAERISGTAIERFVTQDMLRGTELEPIARVEYEILSGNLVEQVGFAEHPTLEFSGASADGLIDDDGAIEIKCPRITTHLKTVAAGVVPPEHEFQMLWVMACCERQWLDFVSFCPELPDGLRLFTVRMHREEARIQQIEAEVVRFEAEIEEILAELLKRCNSGPVAIVEHAPEDMSTWAAAFEPIVP